MLVISRRFSFITFQWFKYVYYSSREEKISKHAFIKIGQDIRVITKRYIKIINNHWRITKYEEGYFKIKG